MITVPDFIGINDHDRETAQGKDEEIVNKDEGEKDEDEEEPALRERAAFFPL